MHNLRKYFIAPLIFALLTSLFVVHTQEGQGRKIDPRTYYKACWAKKPKRVFGRWKTRRKRRSPINMISFQGKLFYTFLGSDGEAYINSSPDGLSFPKPRRIFGRWKTGNPMSLAVFQNKLYLTFVGSSGKKVYIASSSDGKKWPKKPKKLFGGWRTRDAALNIITFKNKLFYAFIGSDGETYIRSSTDGKKFKKPRRIFGRWKTGNPLSMAVHNDKLFMTFIGSSGKNVYIASSKDGKKWPKKPKKLFGGRDTNDVPMNIASYNGRLYYAFVSRGKTGKKPFLSIGSRKRGPGGAYIGFSDTGVNFPMPEKIFGNLKTYNPMGLAVHNGVLYLSFIGKSNKPYITGIYQQSPATLTARIRGLKPAQFSPFEPHKSTRRELDLTDCDHIHLDLGGEGYTVAPDLGLITGFPDAFNVNDKEINHTTKKRIPNLVKVKPWAESPDLPFENNFADKITLQNAPLEDKYVGEIARVLKKDFGEVGLWIDNTSKHKARIKSLAKKLNAVACYNLKDPFNKSTGPNPYVRIRTNETKCKN